MKHKTIFKAAIALSFAFAATASHATDVAVSADLGTTGAGLHLSVPVTQSLNARLGFNGFSYSHNVSTSNVNYDARLQLRTVDVLADWFPFDNSGFRVTGGIVLNYNKVDADARATSGTYTLNGTTYAASSAGNINGKVDFKKLAPYVGIGYGRFFGSQSNWGLSADVGIMYQGSASASLTNSDCTAGTAVCSKLQSDLAAESAKLADKINDYRYWPVVRLGVFYRF